MRVAILTTFAASRKEPLNAMLSRVHLALLAAGLGEPPIAALVKELDRTFVPDFERAAGPSPEWYRPES
jgi:hypothetical protein